MKKGHLFLFVFMALAAGMIFVSCAVGPAGPSGDPGSSVVIMDFQDGVYPTAAYAGTSNARLSASAPDSNNTLFFSAGILSVSSYWRAVVKFDVNALYGIGAVVKKAYLTFNVNTIDGSITVTPYILNNDWTEAEVTWNSYSTGNLWSTAGGDYGAAAGSAKTVSSLGQQTVEINASVVQSWIDNPAQNYGIILKATNETTPINRFHASVRTDGSPEARPRLTVYYKMP